MNSFHFLAISLLVITLYPSQVYGQTKVDSTYLNYINEGWNAAKESNYSDSVQNKYAADFFSYYRENQHSEAGIMAIESAITMWGNTGNSTMMDKAIITLNPDSDIWSRVPNSLGNAYGRDSSRTFEEAMSKLESLNDKVTNPDGKSAILTSLIRVYKRDSETHEKAIRYAQDLVNINESDWYVDFGLGAIYELESLGIGQEAPGFTIKTYQGGDFTLSDHKGKYIIIDFWATWCGPCMPEIPVIKSLRETYGEEDLAIVSIALEEESEEFDNFLSEKGMTWPQIIQQDKWQDEIPSMYNVGGIPNKYIIGPDGTIVAKNIRGEELKRKMAELLSSK